MGDFFESVVDADGGFLRVVLSIDVAKQECAFADGGPADDDCLVVLEG